MKKLVIFLDIDGILCPDFHERFREVYDKKRDEYIKFMNWVYDQGHKVVIFTSRGVNEEGVFDKDALEVTKDMLKDWGLKYTSFYPKPFYDFILEDKGVASIDLFKKMFEKFTGELFYD